MTPLIQALTRLAEDMADANPEARLARLEGFISGLEYAECQSSRSSPSTPETPPSSASPPVPSTVTQWAKTSEVSFETSPGTSTSPRKLYSLSSQPDGETVLPVPDDQPDSLQFQEADPSGPSSPTPLDVSKVVRLQQTCGGPDHAVTPDQSKPPIRNRVRIATILEAGLREVIPVAGYPPYTHIAIAVSTGQWVLLRVKP